MAQCIHWQQWGIACFVAEIIAELSTCELRTTVGLSGDEFGLLAVFQVVTHKGEGDAAKVGSATEAANHHIRIFASHCHLLLSLETDDGLMQTDVVEHRAKGIFTVRCCGGQLNSLGDGSTERSAMGWVLGQNILTGTGGH